jgi:hypothetical protein
VPYCIDYTADVHQRSRWGIRLFLAFLLVALAALGWGGYWTHNEWSRPTLAQQLGAYHRLAGTLEELYAEVVATGDSFDAISPWYTLYWSESVTNVAVHLVEGMERLPDRLTPIRWRLINGGRCELTYKLTFGPGSRREQLDEARGHLKQSLAEWSPEITGRDTDLADLREVVLSVSFNLRSAAYRKQPDITPSFQRAVNQVKAHRSAVRAFEYYRPGIYNRYLSRKADAKASRTVDSLLLAVRSTCEHALRETSPPSEYRDWPDYFERAVDPGALIRDIRSALLAKGIPLPSSLSDWEDTWMQVADRRWPWRRARALDHPGLLADTEQLSALLHGRLPEKDSTLLEEERRALLLRRLPAIEVFRERTERLALLREALRLAMTEAEVFDERKAQNHLDALFAAGWPEGSWRTTLEKLKRQGDLLPVKWEVRLAPGDAKTVGRNDVDPRRVVERFVEISALRYGFEIEEMDVEMIVDRDGRGRVESAKASGLLIVRSAMD